MKIGKHEIISIFKNPKYVENIFNIMINLFKSSLYVRSWGRPYIESTDDVSNIEYMSYGEY